MNKTKLDYYALFGSLSEYIRVALEEIIINWPASLYISPNYQTSEGQTLNGFTVENYTYDNINEISTFRLNTNFIINKFGLVYTQNGSLTNTFNASNTLRNLTLNYESYSILYNNNEYPLIDFTASTTELNDYVYFKVKGDPFSGTQIGLYVYYHVKPNKLKEEQFFNTLPDFQAYLLNRQIIPIYTATFNYPVKSEDGSVSMVHENGKATPFTELNEVEKVEAIVSDIKNVSTSEELAKHKSIWDMEDDVVQDVLGSAEEAIAAMNTAKAELSKLPDTMREINAKLLNEISKKSGEDLFGMNARLYSSKGARTVEEVLAKFDTVNISKEAQKQLGVYLKAEYNAMAKRIAFVGKAIKQKEPKKNLSQPTIVINAKGKYQEKDKKKFSKANKLISFAAAVPIS
jgi:hypothetical protein